MNIRRLAIVGVGLIGGSCALALRAAGAVEHVVGIGRGTANLDRALALGIIDELTTDIASGIANADVILVATPVGQFATVFGIAAKHMMADAVITDGGSTKRDVVAAARSALGNRLSRFVPAHPIAGAEKTGADAAQATLYQDKNVVLTPMAQTDTDALSRVDALWRVCGARVSHMSAEEHDSVFAAVSHLPHVLAYALVDMIAARPESDRLFDFAAGGFRDFTRIASSSPEMWRDICSANRDQLVMELDEYAATIQAIRAMLISNEVVQLESTFQRARDAREAWLKRMQSSLS